VQLVAQEPAEGVSQAAAEALTQYDAEAVDTLILLSYLVLPENKDKDSTITDFLTKHGPHSCSVTV